MNAYCEFGIWEFMSGRIRKSVGLATMYGVVVLAICSCEARTVSRKTSFFGYPGVQESDLGQLSDEELVEGAAADCFGGEEPVSFLVRESAAFRRMCWDLSGNPKRGIGFMRFELTDGGYDIVVRELKRRFKRADCNSGDQLHGVQAVFLGLSWKLEQSALTFEVNDRRVVGIDQHNLYVSSFGCL